MPASSSSKLRVAESSSAEPQRAKAKYLGRSHDSNLGISGRRSMHERARDALVKIRRLCFRCSMAGLNHEQIAEQIDVPLRTLLSYKAGVKVPHVVVEALESLVMRVEKDVNK